MVSTSRPPGRTTRASSASQRSAAPAPKCDHTETANAASTEPPESSSGGSTRLCEEADPGQVLRRPAHRLGVRVAAEPLDVGGATRRGRAGGARRSSRSPARARPPRARRRCAERRRAITSAIQKSPPAASGPRPIAWIDAGGTFRAQAGRREDLRHAVVGAEDQRQPLARRGPGRVPDLPQLGLRALAHRLHRAGRRRARGDRAWARRARPRSPAARTRAARRRSARRRGRRRPTGAGRRDQCGRAAPSARGGRPYRRTQGSLVARVTGPVPAGGPRESPDPPHPSSPRSLPPHGQACNAGPSRSSVRPP